MTNIFVFNVNLSPPHENDVVTKMLTNTTLDTYTYTAHAHTLAHSLSLCQPTNLNRASNMNAILQVICMSYMSPSLFARIFQEDIKDKM